jgi:hypothetical protein
MTIHKVMAGSVLAVGLGVAGMIGAGTAGASPGISFDRGAGDPIGFGDTSDTGAQASASDGNRALAISGFVKPSSATADGEGTGNTVIALAGTATVKEGSDNTLVAVGGSATVKNGDNNRILALGSNVDAKNQSSQTAVALCGKSIVAAQSDKVEVSPGACGGSAE